MPVGVVIVVVVEDELIARQPTSMAPEESVVGPGMVADVVAEVENAVVPEPSKPVDPVYRAIPPPLVTEEASVHR